MVTIRSRFFWPVVLISVCLVTLCAITAVSLFRQQTTVADVFRENVVSRQAAADLRGCLNTLIALESNRVESVSELHAKALVHLHEIRESADQPEEAQFSAKLDGGFAEYLRRWHSLPPPDDPGHAEGVQDATHYLETHVLLPCRDIEMYNDRRIKEATEQHERVLGQLAWGMAGVGGLGGFAGLVLGFGVARGLSQSIRRLQFQIRNAAGKLGPDLPEIVVTEEGNFHGLHEQVDRLTTRIERIVQELQQREREVLRTEQLAAVGQLAAGVAHEVRNPLTSIKMLVQAAMEEDHRLALTREDLGVIEREIRRTERSLQTFLDFARPPKPERRSVDLVAAVKAVVGLVRGRAEKQRVAVRVYAPAGEVVLTADGGQVQQVLVNLILNALDAMPSGGILHVAIRPHPGRVEVEVADTGPGIADDVWPRLFQPFVSAKETGVGLGLVISRRIIDDHGGSITAANRPGGGAAFTVSLPVDGPVPTKAPKVQQSG